MRLQRKRGTALPVAATPIAAATVPAAAMPTPMAPAPAIVPAATPAPMTPAPTPVVATVPAAVMPAPVAPTHLFGLEPIDIILRGDRGVRAFAVRWREAVFRRYRRQRCGLRARSKRCSAGDISKGEFQKMAAFHHISSLAHPLHIVSDEESFVASR